MGETNIKRDARRALWATLAARAISPLFTALGTVFLVRALSPEHYGILEVGLGVVSYLQILGAGGAMRALARFLPEIRLAGSRRELWGVFVWSHGVSAALGFLGLLTLACVPGLREGFSLPLWILLPLAAMTLGSLSANITHTAIEALFLHQYLPLARLWWSLPLLVLSFLTYRLGWGLWGALWAYAAAWVFCGLVALLVFAARAPGAVPGGRGVERLGRRFARFAAYGALTELSVLGLLTATDVFVLAWVGDARGLALYALASRVVMLLGRVAPHRLLAGVVEPVFVTEHLAKGDPRRLAAMFSLTVKLFLSFTLPITAGVLAVGGWAVPLLFGEQYKGAFFLLAWMIVFWNLGSLDAVLYFVASAVEAPQYLFYAKIFSLYNVVMDVILIPALGPLGAVLATTSAGLGHTALLWTLLARRAHLRLHWPGLLGVLANSALLGGLLSLANLLPHTLATLVLAAAGGALLYWGLIRLNSPFTPPERRVLRELIGLSIF